MNHNHHHEALSAEVTWKNWIPLVVVYLYIFILAFSLMNLTSASLDNFFSYSMGLFFMVFSLFKMLDIKGFAEGYSQYDLISKRWYGWGYVFPFIELLLGVLNINLISSTWLHFITVILSMTVVTSVLIELSKHSKFYCACLGTVIKVPLTKVSLIEYLLMAVMALAMLAGL